MTRARSPKWFRSLSRELQRTLRYVERGEGVAALRLHGPAVRTLVGLGLVVVALPLDVRAALEREPEVDVEAERMGNGGAG